MRHVIFSSVACLAVRNRVTISYEGPIFGRGEGGVVIEHKMCFDFFC